MRISLGSIRWQLTLMIGVFGLLFVVQLALVRSLVVNDAANAATIATAGRVRAVAHRVAMESAAIRSGDDTRRADLADGIATLDGLLLALVEGDSRLGVNAANATARSRLQPLLAAWDTVRVSALAVLSNASETPEFERAYIEVGPGAVVVSTEGRTLVTYYQEAVAAREQQLWLLLVASAVAASAITALAWFVSHRMIVRPIERLTRVMGRLSAGSLDVRHGEPYPRGELGGLARTFDEVASVLERDIALERRTLELARSNADLEQFAYVASHDLQEPLRMVINYTQLLARRYGGRLDEDADEFIGYAADGARRMQTLINDLLEYSRVTTRGADPYETDCEEALEDALRNLRVAVEESGAVIVRGPLPQVAADARQLRQVFQNLVGNALKFRQAESPRIDVSATSQEDGLWRISIADNGIGIDPVAGERIFDIFQRLHTREEYEGTGIGLAICKKIIERHGGEIWAEPRQPCGTTLSFTLPGPSCLLVAA